MVLPGAVGTASDTGVARFAVTPVNDPPVAVDDTLTAVAEDSGPRTITTAELLANDTDVEGDTLTVTSVGTAVGGTVVLNDNGTVTFTPTTNFNGPASFDYTVSDGTDTDTGTARFAVTSVNDAPVTMDDMGTTSENAVVTVPVTANDTDVEDAPGSLVVGIANTRNGGTATNGGAEVNGLTVQGGNLTFNPNNYTDPVTGVTGFDYLSAGENATVLIDYNAVDSDGANSNTGTGPSFSTLTITVTGAAEVQTGTDGDDNINGTPFQDILNGGAGNDSLNGGAGNDTINGGSGDDTATFNVTTDGSDTVDLGDGNDVVNVSGDAGQVRLTFRSAGVGNGDANDNGPANSVGIQPDNLPNVRLQAEDGNDGLAGPQSRFDDEGTTFVAGNGITFDVRDTSGTMRGDQFKVVVLGTVSGDTLTATNTAVPYYINGGMGNDTITGGNSNDFLVGGAGNDMLVGGDGNDTLLGGTGADNMNGGAGNDVYDVDNVGDVVTDSSGNDTVNTTVSNFTITPGTSIETINFTGTGNATLAGDDNNNTINGGAGNDTINGNGGNDTLNGNGGNDTINGGDGNDTIRGGEGNDIISGDAGNDIILLNGLNAGDDRAAGGDGNDGFLFGSQFTVNDTVNGGAGRDQLALQGVYIDARLLDVTNVESLLLLSSTDTRFGDQTSTPNTYNITTGDSTVAAGGTLTVDANQLGVGENVTFDGSRETDGSFITFAGLGTDTYIGGANADGFLFRNTGFTAADTVNGGGGRDQLGLQGDYSAGVTLGATTLTSIESIVVLSGTDTRFGRPQSSGLLSYNLTTNDANVAAGQELSIDGASLRIGETLTFNGSAETNGTFRITGGADGDTITAGNGADIVNANGGDDRFNVNAQTGGADTVNLGIGDDTVNVSGSGVVRLTFASGEVGNGVATTTDGLFNVRFQQEDGFDGLTGPISRYDDEGITFSSTTGVMFDVRNFADGAQRGEFNVVTLGSSSNDVLTSGISPTNTYYINGGAGNDTITGGGAADFLVGGTGEDILTGGAGADRYLGGAGADTFTINTTSESTPGAGADQILDFSVSGGDVIDLTAIDANTQLAENQDFTFIGSQSFGQNNTIGELRLAGTTINLAGQSVYEYQGDTDGNGFADFSVFVTSVDAGSPGLTAADFAGVNAAAFNPPGNAAFAMMPVMDNMFDAHNLATANMVGTPN